MTSPAASKPTLFGEAAHGQGMIEPEARRVTGSGAVASA